MEYAAIWAAAGVVAGCVLVPRAATSLLASKRARMKRRWADSTAAWSEFVASNGREPSSSARGAEGALGIWAADARRQAACGDLSREQMHDLRSIGAVSDSPPLVEAEFGDEDVDRAFASTTTASERILCAALLAAWFAAARLSPAAYAVPPCPFLASAAFLVAVAACCDVRAKVLPFEISFSLYPLAAASAMLSGGLEGLAGSVLCALAAWAAFAFASLLYTARGRIDPVGMGDMRTVPAIAMLSGPDGCAAGLAACCVTMAARCAAGMLSGKLTRASKVAMGPYLALWGLIGTAAPLVTQV